ncbi:MAG TPA: acyltransferase, partial [Telluria sp.]|nr:acyltransferase [Telluria sp.]
MAVSLVVLFHGWPKWLKSGFIGVDVFFVISGFLITSIILKDLKRESFSIREFYVRRIRRIFPALLTVLVATLGFGWYVLLHHEFTQLGKHVAGAATFVSNLVLWNESGYFDNSHTTKPLLHFWSLGVEEQFYLVWPLMLAIFFRLRGGILLVLAAALGASFLYGLYTTFTEPAEAYFSPVTRFWELASGGVIAYLLSKKDVVIPARPLFSVAGTAMLVLGAILINSQSPFPGSWALLPVLGTCALILAGPDCLINKYLLGNPLMAYIGRISYPFYLWHWPLLSFGYIIAGEKPEATTKMMLIVASLLLAVLTYHLIERPVQAQPRRGRVIQGLLAGMVCFGVIGAAAQAGLLRERIN